MASEDGKVNPDDIDVSMTHFTKDGPNEVTIPESVKKAMAADLSERGVERKKVLDGIEAEFGKDARAAADALIGWFAHSTMIFRAIHKSNMPMQIEESLGSQESDMQAKVSRILLDLVVGKGERTDEGKLTGDIDTWPQARIVKQCIACSKADIEAMDKASKHLSAFAELATAQPPVTTAVEAKPGTVEPDAANALRWKIDPLKLN